MGVAAKKNSAAATQLLCQRLRIFTFHCALLVGQTVHQQYHHIFLPQSKDTSAHMVDRDREHE